MNDLSHDFRTVQLQNAALKIARALQTSSGITSEPAVIKVGNETGFAFRTDDTKTPTLRTFLLEVFQEEAKPTLFDRGETPSIDIQDEKGSNRRGAVVVPVCSRLADILIAKL